jgi:23S rRNA pseudouridine955/2504/2580 synthase
VIERIVSADAAGQRLDKFLRRALESVPASHLFKLIRTRKVRVNGKRVRGETLLQAGDKVSVLGDEAALLRPQPSGSPATRSSFEPPADAEALSVLFEDESLLVCNKPAGLAIHPGSGIRGATLVDLVRAYLPKAAPGEFPASPGHRLDRDTSGVVLVAKSRRCMVRLTELFTAGDVRKLYLALAKGRFSEPTGVIDIPLAEHQQTQKSRSVHGVKFQPALTHYRVLGATEEVSLLSCRIETGRTHQIRRHLAAVSHPVVGDRRHGDFPFNRRLRAQAGLKRMFLHSWKLELAHPNSNKPLSFTAPLPEELLQTLDSLKLERPK